MNDHTTSWTEGRLEKLKECVANGLSFSQIAAEINRLPGRRLTRNACAGKCHRMGLPRPARTAASAPKIRSPGRPKGELEPDLAALIRKLCANGLTRAQLCERLGVSRGHLASHLRALGLIGGEAASRANAIPPESWAVIDPVLRECWPDNVPTETILDRLRLLYPQLTLPSASLMAVRASSKLCLRRSNLGQLKVLGNALRRDMIEDRFFERVEDGKLFSNTTTPLVRDMLEYAQVPDDAGVDIMALKLDRCRFIIGRTAKGHERYCGDHCRPVKGRVAVWCDTHKPRVFTPAGLRAVTEFPVKRQNWQKFNFSRQGQAGQRRAARA